MEDYINKDNYGFINPEELGVHYIFSIPNTQYYNIVINNNEYWYKEDELLPAELIKCPEYLK